VSDVHNFSQSKSLIPGHPGKDKKRVDKALADSKGSTTTTASKEITPDMLREALEQVKKEDSPNTSEEKEAYFMQHVGLGEQLAQQGVPLTRHLLVTLKPNLLVRPGLRPSGCIIFLPGS
jgi:hypothetical protein